MRERLSVRQVLKDLRRQLPELIEVARMMPTLMKGAVQRAKGGRLQMDVTSTDLEALKEELRRSSRRRDVIPVGAAILFAGLFSLAVSGGQGWQGWGLAIVGVVWLLLAWRRR
jgi:hypothetical protein